VIENVILIATSVLSLFYRFHQIGPCSLRALLQQQPSFSLKHLQRTILCFNLKHVLFCFYLLEA